MRALASFTLLVYLSHGFTPNNGRTSYYEKQSRPGGTGKSWEETPTNNNQTRRRLSAIERSKGAIYRQSVMTKEELSIIQSEISRVISQLHSESSSIAQHRLGASLHPNTDTVRIFREGSLCQLVRRMTNDESMVLSSDLPVQIRSYEKFGASMAWQTCAAHR